MESYESFFQKLICKVEWKKTDWTLSLRHTPVESDLHQ